MASETHVVTNEARLSYVHLTKPYAKKSNDPNNPPKFSVTVLVPKGDVATMQRISAAIELAIQRGVTEKWNGARPPILSIPVYDGDGVRPSDGMPFGAECKGHYVFTASAPAERQPRVVDAQLVDIVDPRAIYSGIYARVGVDFFPFANNGKKGVGVGLTNVQKLRDGEPLGGGTSAEEDFGGATYATQQQGYQPPAYQQPAAPQYPQQQYPQQQYGQQPTAPQGYQQPAAPQGYAAPQYQQPAALQPYQQPGYGQSAPQGYQQGFAQQINAPVTQSYQQQPTNAPQQYGQQQQQPGQINPVTGLPF